MMLKSHNIVHVGRSMLCKISLSLHKNQIFIMLGCSRYITPKRVKSEGVHLHDLSPVQHSSEETSQTWRAVGDAVSDLTDPGFEP